MGKRKHRNALPSFSVGPSSSRPHEPHSPPPLPVPKFGEFKLTSVAAPFTAPTEQMGQGEGSKEGEGRGEWQVSKRQKKTKYPSFDVSPARLRSCVKLSDVQSLVLWLLAEGAAPQWLLVKHPNEIKRVAVVMVPGLELAMFNGELDLGSDNPSSASASSSKASSGWGRNGYYPQRLQRGELQPCLRGFADIFSHVWPIRAPGDDRGTKVFSAITGFLHSPIPKGKVSQEYERNARGRRVGVTKLVLTVGELVENEYPVHSVNATPGIVAEVMTDGWVETDLSRGNGPLTNEAGSVTEGKTIYAMDCEMVQTMEGLELARISVVGWEGETVYDTLVKPDNRVTDYLTPYSGMTKEKIDPITTTLKDVQNHLLSLFDNNTVLVGQSLNADLGVVRFAHPHIVDTSIIYNHPRGAPYKASLKWLSTKFLKREIQKGGANGHDSIEDAKACLDLLKLKLEKGLEFGTSNLANETIFKRLSRVEPVARTGGIVDYGTPEKWWGPAAATRVVRANDDAEVVSGVVKCIQGDPIGTRDGHPKVDLVWSRMCALETLRGWNRAMAPDNEPPLPVEYIDPGPVTLAQGVQKAAEGLKEIYNSLPPCTAFIVYSGTGDPREMWRLQDMQREHKRQYATMKWDELTVKWTDTENQALTAAVRCVREGIGFLTVK